MAQLHLHQAARVRPMILVTATCICELWKFYLGNSYGLSNGWLNWFLANLCFLSRSLMLKTTSLSVSSKGLKASEPVLCVQITSISNERWSKMCQFLTGGFELRPWFALAKIDSAFWYGLTYHSLCPNDYPHILKSSCVAYCEGYFYMGSFHNRWIAQVVTQSININIYIPIGSPLIIQISRWITVCIPIWSRVISQQK